MKIAVLNSDVATQQLICNLLSTDNHTLYSFSNVSNALNHLRHDNIELLVLDCPEELLKIKAILPSSIPVLFLAGRALEGDIMDSLAAGAHDYLCKPLRQNELITRVRVLVRRFYPDQLPRSERMELGRYVLETKNARIFLAQHAIKVTQKEFELAWFLFKNAGKPLSRAFILETIWAKEPEIPSRTLDTHISRVRNKLQLMPENGFRLAPIYSYGYLLEQV